MLAATALPATSVVPILPCVMAHMFAGVRAIMAQSVYLDNTNGCYSATTRVWGRNRLDLVSAQGEVVDLAWLMDSLKHARSRGQVKLVAYLESIADDAVFEMEMAARSSRR